MVISNSTSVNAVLPLREGPPSTNENEIDDDGWQGATPRLLDGDEARRERQGEVEMRDWDSGTLQNTGGENSLAMRIRNGGMARMNLQ
jgi:hypothetical protein